MYILVINRKPPLNRFFIIICASFASSVFLAAFVYPAEDPATARLLLGVPMFAHLEKVLGVWLFSPYYPDPWYFAYVGYCFLSTVLCIALLLSWRRRDPGEKTRRQSRIVGFSLLAVLLLTFWNDVLLRVLIRDYPIALLAPFFWIVWIAGIWYAIAK